MRQAFSFLATIRLLVSHRLESLSGADDEPPPLPPLSFHRTEVGVLGESSSSLIACRGLSGNTNSPLHSRPHHVSKSLPPCGCILEFELRITRARMNFNRSDAVMTSVVARNPATKLVVKRPPESFSIEFSAPVVAVMTTMDGCLSSSAGLWSSLGARNRRRWWRGGGGRGGRGQGGAASQSFEENAPAVAAVADPELLHGRAALAQTLQLDHRDARGVLV